MEKTSEDDKDKFVFFLSGHDPEIIAIKEILKANKVTYYSKPHDWGAKFSEFKDQIPLSPVLNSDIKYSTNVIITDLLISCAPSDKVKSRSWTSNLEYK